MPTGFPPPHQSETPCSPHIQTGARVEQAQEHHPHSRTDKRRAIRQLCARWSPLSVRSGDGEDTTRHDSGERSQPLAGSPHASSMVASIACRQGFQVASTAHSISAECPDSGAPTQARARAQQRALIGSSTSLSVELEAFDDSLEVGRRHAVSQQGVRPARERERQLQAVFDLAELSGRPEQLQRFYVGRRVAR